jgi:hypothetical protein
MRCGIWDLGCEKEHKAKGASREAGLEARGEERRGQRAERMGHGAERIERERNRKDSTPVK